MPPKHSTEEMQCEGDDVDVQDNAAQRNPQWKRNAQMTRLMSTILAPEDSARHMEREEDDVDVHDNATRRQHKEERADDDV